MSDVAKRQLALALQRKAQLNAQAPAEAGSIDVNFVGDRTNPQNTQPKVSMAERQRLAQQEAALFETPKAVQYATKFIQGLPFVGEYFDEGLDAISPGAGQMVRDVNDGLDAQSPKTSTALQIAGGVTGSIPLALGGVGLVGQVQGPVAKVATAAGLGAVTGAVEGGISGFGRGDSPDGRAKMARDGALTGLAVGGVAGAAAPALGKLGKEAIRRFKRLDVKTIAEEFGLSPKAANVVKRALQSGDFAEVQKRLELAGDGAMLADANQATGQLLDAASATGGRALQVTRDAVDGRANTAGRKLNAAFDRILGKPVGVKTAARAVSKRTSASRQAAYAEAYSKPIDYSKAGRKIEAVLERVPPKTLKAAIDEANEAMMEAGTKNAQILADIGDDGAVVFREMPNVQQLDELKKALGEVARGESDQFGRLTSKGIRNQRLARDLRNALGEAVPEYSRAVKLGGDKIAEDIALDTGRNIFGKRTTVEDIADVMRGASDDARNAIRQGIRENIDNTLSNVRRTITDPNVDAREAMQAVKELSSRANRDKLRLALGSSSANKLLKELDTATSALELRAMVATNSKTAVRQSVQDQVAQETAPGIIATAAHGEGVGAVKRIIQGITGATDEVQGVRKQAIFDEIATALTAVRGPDAAKAMRMVERAMSGQPLKDAEAEFVANLLGGGSATLIAPTSRQIQGRE